jgi:hypothetical protein
MCRPVHLVPYRIERRLSAVQVDELVQQHEDGATGRQLADRYGLARSTVIEPLDKRGATVRASATDFRRSGAGSRAVRARMRQVDVALRLGRHKSVIWHVLRRGGEA